MTDTETLASKFAVDNFAGVTLDNSYARLPERFYARLDPTPVKAPTLRFLNEELALALGLRPEQLTQANMVAVLAGNSVVKESEPLAMAYAGHQFGHFVPQLGDGRALLLGEVVDNEGTRWDVQLKGSGPTPFSRRGDGRAAIGPVLREYIVSEAMHALGVASTRSLAVVETGQRVIRERPLPGAILTRIAKSHVRVGTFEYFASRQDHEAIRLLADYVIERHFPEAKQANNPYIALLGLIADAQTRLIAHWMQIGFIHGVMNTDNMSICGETIDFGPCAFMDEFDSAKVFSSIDRLGRYSFGNQGNIGLWNLTRLAECLLALFADKTEVAVAEAKKVLEAYPASFERYWLDGMGTKLGLHIEKEDNSQLIADYLGLLSAQKIDYTLAFRYLADGISGNLKPLRGLFQNFLAFDDWFARYEERLKLEDRSVDAIAQEIKQKNPLFIPRNHRVEEAIAAALEGDFSKAETLITVLGQPFSEQPQYSEFAKPPREDQRVLMTFCGT